MYKIYKSKINELKIKERTTRQKSTLLLIAKLSAFLSSAYFGYLSFTAFSTIHLTATLTLFFVYLYLCVKDNTYRKKIDLLNQMQKVCQYEIDYLNGNLSHFNAGDSYLDQHHAYSFDLDIFGEKSLFQRINRTITEKGSDRLAYKLTHLAEYQSEILNHQESIQELAHLTDWRILFMSQPYISNQLEQLTQFIKNNPINHRFIRSSLPYLLIGLTSISLLLAITGFCTWHYFEILFLINLGTSMLFRKTLSKANLQAEKLHKDFTAYQGILSCIQQMPFQSTRLQEIQKELFEGKNNSIHGFQELTKILNFFNLRGSDILYLLLNGTLLFDVILIKRFTPWCQQYLPHIEKWINFIAEIDAYVSMGNYASNHPTDTYATFVNKEEDILIEATDIFHPFLNREKAIPNSFTLNKKNIAIITGANMAGKSTFLRTIGISYILATNGMPVCASSFRISLVSLFSSMRTTDNLSKDISYFHAELLRLKQLIQHVQSHQYTLIILDEILKGTNSRDKLEGSILFLRQIADYPISAIIATHDLELAKLEKENGQLYANYRFEIELSEEIRYTYKMERGIAQNLNASYLLSNMLKNLQN